MFFDLVKNVSINVTFDTMLNELVDELNKHSNKNIFAHLVSLLDMSGLRLKYVYNSSNLVSVVIKDAEESVIKTMYLNDDCIAYLKRLDGVFNTKSTGVNMNCVVINYDLTFTDEFLNSLHKFIKLSTNMPIAYRIGYLVAIISDKVISKFDSCLLTGIELCGEDFSQVKLHLNVNVNIGNDTRLSFMKTIILGENGIIDIHTKLPRVF